MIDHVSVIVSGFCHADGSDLWISQGDANTPPFHVAFRVPSRAAVDAFYEAAIAAGGRDNGAPGPRPQVTTSRPSVTRRGEFDFPQEKWIQR
jgi:hypothetical protein